MEGVLKWGTPKSPWVLNGFHMFSYYSLVWWPGWPGWFVDTPQSRWAQREPLFFSKFFAINNMESNFLDTAIFRFSPIHLLYYVILSPMKSFGRNWSCNVLNCVCVYITIERFRLAYSLNKTRRYSSSGSILISMAGPRLGIADGIGCHFFISLHTQTKWKNIWAVSDKNKLYLKNCTPNGMGYTSKIMIGNMMIHQ